MFEQFETNETNIEAKFRVVQVYEPKLALTGNIVSCKYFQPDLNLLNKAIKSTRGVGFIPVMLEETVPKYQKLTLINQNGDSLPAKKIGTGCFLSLLISAWLFQIWKLQVSKIFWNSMVNRSVEKMLWDLYLTKTSNGNEKYSLRQLLEFANEKNDDVLKINYITSLLSELDSESIFPVDSPISLYDNVIVGRKRSASGGSTGTVSATVEDDLTDIEETTDYEKYAKS